MVDIMPATADGENLRSDTHLQPRLPIIPNEGETRGLEKQLDPPF